MIQTAEELIDHDTKACVPYEHCKDLMVQFAKLHLKAQKEAIIYVIENWMPEIDTRAMDKVDNAYDLDNIK